MTMPQSNPNVPVITLNDGRQIPQLGYGVYKIPDTEVPTLIHTALDAGYRAIDTATFYKNEHGVGVGIASANIPREECFITTKVWPAELGTAKSRASVERSLELLGMDHVDLLLIHWPAPARDLYVETWETFIEMQHEGLATSIGVSNFTEEHLTRLIQETGVTPVVNQVELHPWLPQADLRAFHAAHDIHTEAWSPLARGRVIDNPVLAPIAAKHGVTPAQIVLRWHVQLGNIVIPKSRTPKRIVENIDVFDFTLDDADLAAIATLASGERTGRHPNDYNG